MKKLLIIGTLVAATFMVSGCSNVGNENPITPEMMDKERAKQADARANFNPGNPPKPGN